MDIFKIAEEYFWLADYYDPKTGNIYKITEAKKFNGDIPVVNADGKLIGMVSKSKEYKIPS